MCGIISYCGNRQAIPILIDGLKRLEYRGYDSAGLSTVDKNKMITIKTVGKVSQLENKTAGTRINSSFGIAHTRWA
ncbi:MAG: glutamine--fructose-6-phosphate aminotransferase, partial [Candidatus Aminicenantes bacterium]|nr:glutamine--fructose-6-phosphate aminotransferase [Candidatus Aminicenantes bacterium]